MYIAVMLFVDELGRIAPVSIEYKGRTYEVDKVIDVRTAPPEFVGGLITKRYDCLIRGAIRHIYMEASGRWFVEEYK